MKRARKRTPRASRSVTLPRSAEAGLSELRRAQRRGAARYRREGEVARGEMGDVVKVWDRLLHRHLAMKLQPMKGTRSRAQKARRTGKAGHGADADAVARFLREGQIAAQLQHPGVIPVHDMGVDERGRLYYTMPLIEGRELGALFEEMREPDAARGDGLARSLLALARVCDVVGYAHSRGVVHGDLNPANVLIGPFDELYVVDWGLATLTSERERDDGDDVVVRGTPPYLSPEQAEGRIGSESDVYAIGAMLYRLLAGRGPYLPWHGREDASKTIELIKRGAPTPIGLIAADAPAELTALCTAAMAREPKQRPRPQELADRLRRVAASRDGGKSRP